MRVFSLAKTIHGDMAKTIQGVCVKACSRAAELRSSSAALGMCAAGRGWERGRRKRVETGLRRHPASAPLRERLKQLQGGCRGSRG